MSDWVVGILLVVIGLMFCFRGYVAMRFVIPFWGAMTGFFLGAGMVASFGGDGFLSTVLGWAVGLGVGLLFGALAYLYYEVAIIIAMSAIGYVLGTGLIAAMGVTWNWVIVLVGLTMGFGLALFSILFNMPAAVLTVLTATAGATAIITGLLVLLDRIDVAELGSGATAQEAMSDTWWWLIYGGLVIAGIIAQSVAAKRFHASIRQAWEDQGGRTLRSP